MKPEEGDIKRDYCAGVLSIGDVAIKHGIAKSTLIDLAKRRGWIRKKKPPKKPTKKPTKKPDQNKNGRTVGRSEKTEINLSAQVKAELLNKESKQSDETIISADEFGLSEQQAIFAEYVVSGKTLVDAYRLAGYQAEGNGAYVNASRLLRNAKVSRYVRHLKDNRQKRHAANLDEIVHQLVSIVSADPNELSQHRRVNCRHCWGENHLYQWIDIGEHDAAAEKAAKDSKPAPEYGGIGFIDNAPPNPDCPKCGGEGNGSIFIADTRDLEGAARWLYAGVKETRFGIEVLTVSQEAARRDLIKLLTMKGRSGVAGDENMKPKELSDFYAEQTESDS